MIATQDVQSPRSASVLSDEELMERMRSRRHFMDTQEILFAQDAAEFAARETWEDEGSASAIDWLRFNCHMTGGAASNSIAVGKAMGRVPESLQAMSEGEVGYAHLVVMVRTANAVGSRFDERALVENARESSPGKFYYTCDNYRHAVDATRYAAEQTNQVENRRLRLNTAMDGSLLISGILDSIGGAVVRTALEPLAKKSGEHDDREREQRLADALVELAVGNKPAQIQVTSSLETLLGLCGAPAGEMEFALPISTETVQRLACDSSVARILGHWQLVRSEVGKMLAIPPKMTFGPRPRGPD